MGTRHCGGRVVEIKRTTILHDHTTPRVRAQMGQGDPRQQSKGRGVMSGTTRPTDPSARPNGPIRPSRRRAHKPIEPPVGSVVWCGEADAVVGGLAMSSGRVMVVAGASGVDGDVGRCGVGAWYGCGVGLSRTSLAKQDVKSVLDTSTVLPPVA